MLHAIGRIFHFANYLGSVSTHVSTYRYRALTQYSTIGRLSPDRPFLPQRERRTVLRRLYPLRITGPCGVSPPWVHILVSSVLDTFYLIRGYRWCSIAWMEIIFMVSLLSEAGGENWRMWSISFPELQTDDDMATSESGQKLVEDTASDISSVNAMLALLRLLVEIFLWDLRDWWH